MLGQERIVRVDNQGESFEIGVCGRGEFEPLLDMYDVYFPEAVTQGLPPSNPDARVRWIDQLMNTAHNLIAWKEDKIVGHSALLTDLERRDAEYMIFVGHPFRKRGIGNELTALTIEEARRMGLINIWLAVEADNFKAIRLYRKFGFRFRGKGGWERNMNLDL